MLEREVMRTLESETQCCGVSVAQCHVLLELSGQPRSLSALAAAMDLDTSTLSRTVDGLVKAGLIERREDPRDRRSVRLTVAPAGSAKVAFINETCNRYYADLFQTMSADDREHVLRGVTVLAERMRDVRLQPGCSADQARLPNTDDNHDPQ